ncbi:hypothetical protein IPM62_05145 [Candidatus Woesebacteria bacterium]|nr:MAG: hypothetical protein IPM62_05145 [Candidatus Woesebacteria bacterium]
MTPDRPYKDRLNAALKLAESKQRKGSSGNIVVTGPGVGESTIIRYDTDITSKIVVTKPEGLNKN